MNLKSPVSTTYEEIQNVRAVTDLNISEEGVISPDQPILRTVRQLCQALDLEEISYCHWKSNSVINGSTSGENDLDLLVSREDVTRFSELLYQLGFNEHWLHE
jgi:hypothetical protein